MKVIVVRREDVEKAKGFEQVEFPKTWIKRLLISRTPKKVVDPTREGLASEWQTERMWMGIFYAAPGSGEDTWHSHPSYNEVMFYVMKGKGRIEWKEDGKEHRILVRKGDFFYLPPSLPNRMLNTGKNQFVLLYIAHYHDDLKGQKPVVYSGLTDRTPTRGPK